MNDDDTDTFEAGYRAGYASGYAEAYNDMMDRGAVGTSQILHHMFDFWQDALTSWAASDKGGEFDAPILRIPENTLRKPITGKLRRRIIVAHNFTCHYCRRFTKGASIGPGGRPWHIDHVLPLAHGGTHTEDNFTLSCAHCNLVKRDRL